MSDTAAAVRNSLAALAVGIGAFTSGVVFAGPIVFQDGGTNDPSSIQSTVDAFRVALGAPNNGNAPGPLASGRREINWDGGGSTATTAPVTPFNVFQNTRGVQVTTPGTGLTQATPDGLATLIGNATYATTFGTFSAARLFSPVGSNITDVVFFIPGSNGTIAATVGGFGAVFTDVDLADTTKIEFFDGAGTSLHSGFAPAGTTADASLSFYGVRFDAGEQVARVRFTTGTNALGPTTNDNPAGNVDVVGFDDFLIGEPRAVPVPATLALLGLGLAGLAACRRRRT